MFNGIGYQGDVVFSYQTSWDNAIARIDYAYTKFLKKTETVSGTQSTSSSVLLSYDNDRLLTAVGAMTLARDAATAMVSSTSLGNVTESYRYSGTYGETSGYQVKYAGAEIYKELYTRDLFGRVNRKVVSSGGAPRTLDYVYDSAGRLKEVWTDRSLTRAYHYDANSNRTSVVSGAGTVSATYDCQDRLMSYGNYTYNARGELSQRTETGSAEVFTYAYDSMGSLSAVSRTWDSGGTVVTDNFTYRNDAFGRRVEVLKNEAVQGRYLYNESGQLVAELDGNGNLVSHFIYVKTGHSPDYMIRSGVRYK